MSDKPAVLAHDLHKRFGTSVALAGLDLSVATGTVHAVLGPNGAGKTTAVKILTTLLRADSGHAEVLGLDVSRRAGELRSRIGLTGQYAAVDERLTGQENLEMFGRLYRLSVVSARARAETLLERFDLTDAARRQAGTYSGGMRRRLDLAASLILAPPMLFLDEPTTGLDPRSRIQMWKVIEELVRDGTTVLLTTQYLEEADQLARRISVIDGGRVIAEGTADDLKSQVGGDRLDIVITRGGDVDAARGVLARFASGEVSVDVDRRRLSAPMNRGAGVLPDLVRGVDEVGVALEDIALHRPTLDDVFLALTGHHARDEGTATSPHESTTTEDLVTT
ncbi:MULTISPECIES: daunorubicin resistance protein DrrA family ABC transporter ATP-binding protein [Protofrankia]|uniref:Daunorubicin resistance ABC transporter ATPase subunit n=1 Tax=Candidatus Protofrankia datiscae TaxID=2716812 RepID=F8AZ03_9ACTN|nr:MULTISPECIES: daunorubicin resistance protein DrrA family ABC transporter ATP-binding protein [Protofrankia]AEH09591.1 daunorubicin resistance ABC transporter ATPase subunit [Candidatus Protofrankia datiscae]